MGATNLLLLSYYNRIIVSTQSIGAMLRPMAQLRRGQLRMVVYVVGSCWWCDQLSDLARHTHKLHCQSVPTFSWLICTDLPQCAVCLKSSSVFDSDLLLEAFSWVQYVAMYSGGSGCFPLLLSCCRNPCILRPVLRDDTYHLLSLPVVRLTGLESAWRHFILCAVVQDVPVVFHCFPCQFEGGCFPP